MNRSFFVGGLLAATVALSSGCSVRNYKPTGGAETARLTLVRGATFLGGRSLQVYSGYRDARCSAGPGNGRLAALLTYATTRKTATVEAGRRLYVAAGLHDYSVAAPSPDSSYRPGLTIRRGTCINVVSFVPQPRRDYEILQDETPTVGCGLRVTELGAGAPPSDLTIENANDCPDEAVQ
ncbi:hypothetical protein ABIE09_001264 [Lysobacter enzymogenes]|uniref:hypothetical protein n=1 Tax=Lysobacter enzymogenes TaxID=69 RepID=UPI00339884E7